jgi:hypothetical protein
MENQGFNYELEAEKISDLFNQNYKLGLEAKNSFRIFNLFYFKSK